MKIGIAILTLNGEQDLRRLLPIVCAEPGVESILVVDSQSDDGTQQVGAEFENVKVVEFDRREFNHGATREFARQTLGTEIVVFLTQDVVPEPGFVAHLVAPLCKGEAAVTYARQLPHEGAGVLESFPRKFNYPATSNRRTLEDVSNLGVMTFFCSDSCSAYLNSALDQIGGISSILTNEDYFTVAKLLQHGFAIYYCAESRVQHSHSYSIKSEFQRYFDTGYVRGERQWVNQLVGQAERHGSSFVVNLMLNLVKTSPWLIPYACLQIAAKWLGYRIGYLAPRFPPSVCSFFSSQKYYWTSRYYLQNKPVMKEVI